MKLLDVICAKYDQGKHLMHLVKEVEMEDGTVHLNLSVFAPETLAARSGQYEIDDVDELVDMVVYGAGDEELKYLNMSASAARSLHRERTAVIKNSLAQSKDTKASRLEKLRKAGVGQEYLDAAEEDFVEVIKRHCTPDPKVVKHFKQEAAVHRKRIMEAQSPEQITKTQAKFEALRQAEMVAKTRMPKMAPKKSAHVKITMHKSKRIN